MFKHHIQIDKIKIQGQEVEINNVKLLKNCYDEGNFIGTAIAVKLEFDAESNINFEGKSFEYFSGVIKNGKTSWTSLGMFHVIDVSRGETTNNTSVVALDNMLKFNIPYMSDLDYAEGNITLEDVLHECCDKCNVVLDENMSLANAGFIVDSNQFTDGQLVRDVIIAIAQVSGNFAQIIDNKLVFKNTNATDIVLDDTMYEKLDIKENASPINTVSLRNSQIEGENITKKEEHVTEETENLLVIEDNPFAYSQEKRIALIDALFDNVRGLGYVPFEMNGQGGALLNCGDLVKVKTMNGMLVDSMILSVEYHSPDGVNSMISAPAITKSSVQYQNSPSVAELLKQTEVKVDKAEGQISMLAQRQDVLSENIGDVSDRVDMTEEGLVETKTMIEQTADEILATMSKTGGNNLVKNSVAFNGIKYWEASEGLVWNAEQSSFVEQNTESGSGFALTNGSLKQDLSLLTGEVYTLAFRYTKEVGRTDQNAIAKISAFLDGEEHTVLKTRIPTEKFEQVEYTFEAKHHEYTIKFLAEDTLFAVYDLRITRGETAQAWTQASGEVYGKHMQLDENGLTMRDLSGSTIELNLNNKSIVIKNGDTIVAEHSPHQSYSDTIKAKSKFEIGSGVVFKEIVPGRIIGYMEG